MLEQRVTIIGLGLMGGSLAMALRPFVRHLTAVDIDDDVNRKALQEGLVDAASPDPAEGVAEADLVVAAVPAQSIVVVLSELPAWRPDGCMVMDVGSTKKTICETMETLPSDFAAIGGHPMCGREHSGLGAATPDLFRNRTFALCRTSRTTHDIEGLALKMVECLQAQPLFLTPARHDRIAAMISHLPRLVSAALMRTAAEVDDALLWPLSSTGFQSVTRLAANNPSVMRDILLTNKTAILQCLARYEDHLSHVRTLLEADDQADIVDWFEASREEHEHYQSKRRSR